MQDPEKIEAILTKYNADEVGAPWLEVQGSHMLYAAETTDKGQNFKVITEKGMVVKTFLNGETGELKMYLFREISK